jgi:hypothetical protein
MTVAMLIATAYGLRQEADRSKLQESRVNKSTPMPRR